MKTAALDYLSRNAPAHADMLLPIRRGSADILAAGPEGVLLYETIGEVHMLAATGEAEALRLLDMPERPALLAIHSETAAHKAAQRFGLGIHLTVHQAVWTQEAPPPLPETGLDIRLLDSSWAERVNELYSHDMGLDYMEARLVRGELWGAFEGEALAGFIGRHAEGSMGMLEVLPDFRRRGIGRALAAFLIGETLKKGLTPFSQFQLTNHASRQLNQSLGMHICPEIIYWLW